MNIQYQKIIIIVVLSFLYIGCQHNYALRKKWTKQNGYIIIDNENRVFFVPCSGNDATLNGFILHHKEYAIWITAYFNDKEMDTVRNGLKYIGVRVHQKDGNIDTFGVAPVQVQYSLRERAPKWMHGGGVFNSVFYINSSLVKFTYFEAMYNVSSIKLR